MNINIIHLIDRECPLLGKATETNGLETDPLFLMHQMREEGLAIKSSALGVRQNMPGANQVILMMVFNTCFIL